MDFNLKLYDCGITHNGTFHADDVLSTCLLMLLNSNFKYSRQSDIPNQYNGIVYDVGGGKYDHHGDVKRRNNGKTYAAFGLLWKDYGSCFMDQDKADLFDEVFISEIDRCDTSSNTNLLTSSIEYFNPTWNSHISSDEAFQKAVKVFLPILDGLIAHFKNSTFIPRYCKTLNTDIMIAMENINRHYYHNKNLIHYDNPNVAWNLYYKTIFLNDDNDLFYNTFLNQVNKVYGKYKTSPFILAMSFIQRRKRIEILEEIILERIYSINALTPAKEECERIYRNSKRKDLLIFDKYIPNTSISLNHEEVKGIIFPSERGVNVLLLEMNDKEKIKKGIDPKQGCRRMYFPEILRGKDRSELETFSKGLFFVHPSGHIAACENLEDAIQFYNKIC